MLFLDLVLDFIEKVLEVKVSFASFEVEVVKGVFSLLISFAVLLSVDC